MKTRILTAILVMSTAMALVLGGCAASEQVTSKLGAQLWSENCLRCHNAPDPADYSDKEWDAVGVHMQSRSNALTEVERDKIVEFLKTAN